MGEYDPELIPKGTKDVSALEEKVLSDPVNLIV